MNLNEEEILTDGNPAPEDRTLADNSCIAQDHSTEVYFRNIERILIQKIQNADIILGCVAWLTNKDIIDSMSNKKAVSLVVQKEDFLRPDSNWDQRDNWKQWLQNLYAKLPGDGSEITNRYNHSFRETSLYMLSRCGDPYIDPVRCVGNYNRSKAVVHPRMHNKFILFCKMAPSVPKMREENYNVEDPYEDYGIPFEPYAVWTGSYNFTQNSGNSFENGLYLTDKAIVDSYFKEYGHIMALSEPLDWTEDYVRPQWRIGT
jgi:hypothetical protein